jgi:hypothetical protein
MYGHRPAGRLGVILLAATLLGACGAGATPAPATPAPATPAPATPAPATPTPAAPTPAATTDEALLADLAAVMSDPYDAARLATLYAPNAVIHETTANQTQTGLDEIGARIRSFNEAKFEAVVTSAPIRQGDYVAAFSKYGTGGDLSGRALVVDELQDGKVLNQWVYDATSSPAAPSSAAESPAAVADEALVADLAAAWANPYDAAKVATLYAPNAVVHELTDANLTSTGLEAIQARVKELAAGGFEVAVTSAPIRQASFVAAFHKYGTGGDLTGRGLVVYELKDGKVLNQWVYSTP